MNEQELAKRKNKLHLMAMRLLEGEKHSLKETELILKSEFQNYSLINSVMWEIVREKFIPKQKNL